MQEQLLESLRRTFPDFTFEDQRPHGRTGTCFVDVLDPFGRVVAIIKLYPPDQKQWIGVSDTRNVGFDDGPDKRLSSADEAIRWLSDHIAARKQRPANLLEA